MLNSKKLLYIFSDVAYVAELLPAKKKGDFKIHEFRQINGTFLDNDTFVVENIEKLFSKIDKEEYLLVLPDFFFTNTIVEVGEKAKTKVEKYIKEELLPSLSITEETHQVEHFILTQYGDKSNVQLSAIERSLLSPIYDSSTNNDIKISGVVSVSWTIKSLISLEPSLSLAQMGENLYLVQHYIGVDQATSAAVTDVSKISETIKTLKGAEPSIQTVYLLTNELVEEELKDLLKSTLPLQQLSDFKDDDSDLPSYVKQVIEAGAKTMSVTDFNVPDFKVEEVDESLVKAAQASSKDDEKEEKTDEEPEKKEADKEEKVTEDTDASSKKTEAVEPLPEPTAPPAVTETEEEPEEKDAAAEDDTNDETDDKEEEADTEDETPEEITEKEPEKEKKSEKDAIVDENDEDETLEMKEKEEKITVEEKKTPVVKEAAGDSDPLTKFAVPEEEVKKQEKLAEEKVQKEVIKNKTGVSSMLKMVFVSVSVFFLTVAVGVGLGLGYLTMTNTDETPAQVAESPSPEPQQEVVEPSPSPSPEPEIDKAEVSILVVNATTKAGYAGDIGDLLEEDDFEDVDAGNAKGNYDEGLYILMDEENQGLINLIEEATNLEFEFSDEIKVEDTQGNYDAVIVLAE